MPDDRVDRNTPTTDYSVYIVRCADETYYTGISTDVERRLREHRGSLKGAKYLRGRAPFSLVYVELIGDRSAASRAEYWIKRLSRRDKQRLIDGELQLPDTTASQRPAVS